MNKTVTRIAWVLVYLLTIAFSIKNLKEPDTWWQLRAGEWIMENKTIPHTDPFSFTFYGSPWTNIKWGYEVLIALFVKLTSPECIPLLQAVISCFMIFFLVKTARLLLGDEKRNADWLLLPIIILFLIASEYRMTGRPEMFSHLLTVIFLYILLSHLKRPSRLIYAVIPLEVLWCNLHEGYGIGIVLVLLVTIGSWIAYRYAFQPIQKPIPLTLVSLLVIVSVVISPYGIDLILKPFGLFQQVEQTKYTTEFLDFTHYLFWEKETYITLAIVVISFLGIVLSVFRQRKQTKHKKKLSHYFLQQEPLVLLLLVFAFTYLASTAYRNIIFLTLIATPLCVWALAEWKGKVQSWFLAHSNKVGIAMIIITAIGYVLVVSQKYYSWTEARNRFGLEILSTNTPENTAEFLQKNHLERQVFSDYLTSSYFLWRLQPDFKTFIDLRDYEIFTPEFFQQYANATVFPETLLKLDSQYHFHAFVVFRQQMSGVHRFLYNDSNFRLSHLDAVTAVYKRDTSKLPITYNYAEVIPSSEIAKVVNKILNPFYAPYEYGEINEDQNAAAYYITVSDWKTALTYVMQSFKKDKDKHASYNLLGQIYLNTALSDTMQRSMKLDSARTCFLESVKLKSDFADAYLGLGAVSFQQQRTKDAIKNFELCVKYAPDMLNAHLYLGQCYNSLSQQGGSQAVKNIQLALKHYLEAERLNPDNPFITANVGFLYARLGDCGHAVPYLEQIEDFQGLSAADRQYAKESLNRCR